MTRKSTGPIAMTSSEVLAMIEARTNKTSTADNVPPPPDKQVKIPDPESVLEDQLIAVMDGIASLGEQLYELREVISRLPTRAMIEALSEKLDCIRELLEAQNGDHDQSIHVEWPDDE